MRYDHDLLTLACERAIVHPPYRHLLPLFSVIVVFVVGVGPRSYARYVWRSECEKGEDERFVVDARLARIAERRAAEV